MRKLSLIFVIVTLVACQDDYTPKPMGYFRIGIPEKSYSTLEDNSCNYSFDLNNSAVFKEVANKNCWADVVYPNLKATVQLTYYSLKEKDLRVEIDNSDDGFEKKVRKAKTERVPYFVIIGDKEVEENKVTLESRDNGQVGTVSFEELVENLK